VYFEAKGSECFFTKPCICVKDFLGINENGVHMLLDMSSKFSSQKCDIKELSFVIISSRNSCYGFIFVHLNNIKSNVIGIFVNRI
jgi:hypothetical protein